MPMVGGGGAALEVELVDATGGSDGPWLDGHIRRACAALGVVGQVRVRLVGDEEMSRAHLEFAEVEGTTDVLTFDLTDGHSAESGVLDVDILACVDEASRQAKTRGHEPRRELLLYIVHGILHCLGHDDHDEAAYGRMHAEEDRILSLLGVGATFAREEGSR